MRQAGNFIERNAAWLFPLPAVIALVVLIALPMLANFVIALHDWFIGRPPTLVGFQNFTDVLADRRFYNGVKNTLIFSGVAVPLTAVAPADLPRLAAASGQGPVTRTGDAASA